MKYEFKNFNISDYDKVYDFLVKLSQENRVHINWNWARWEWMFFHPEFDRSLLEKIGLWFSNNDLVGVAIYDHYFGEAFFATRKGFEELQKDILEYVVKIFSDENGIGIAVNDADTETLDLLTDYGFVINEQTENVLELSFREFDFNVNLMADISLGNINLEKDLYKHHELLLYVDTYEEVDEEYAKSISKGATSVLEPETEPWGQRTCYIADPEGNLIEIGSFNRPFER